MNYISSPKTQSVSNVLTRIVRAHKLSSYLKEGLIWRYFPYYVIPDGIIAIQNRTFKTTQSLEIYVRV